MHVAIKTVEYIEKNTQKSCYCSRTTNVIETSHGKEEERSESGSGSKTVEWKFKFIPISPSSTLFFLAFFFFFPSEC